MSEKYILVFDVGTGAGRVVLFNHKGKMLGKSYEEWSYEEDIDGLHFSSEKFWMILKRCVKDVLEKTSIDTRHISAITSTSQREGIVLLGKNGKPLYAGPNLDGRGEKFNKKFAEKYGEDIYFKTGHWPEKLFAPGRINWFKEKKPETYKNIGTMLLLNDWILYKLTGKMYSEPTNASETLLYNLNNNNWDMDLLSKMNIPPEFLPEIKKCSASCDYLKSELAEEWGIPNKTPVIIGAADTQSALLGMGLLNSGQVGIVAGSTCPIQLITDKPVYDNKKRTWTGAFIKKGKYVLEANARPTGLLLRWIRDSFYSHLSTGDAFKKMEKEAQEISPGSYDVRSFLGPLISNVKNEKVNNLRNIIGFPNDLFSGDGRKVLIRSALENIAFAIKSNIDLLYDITGRKIKKIVITGGNTNNLLLLKILSSLLDYPLYKTKQDETTALGAATCAAVGAGIYEDFSTAVSGMSSSLEIIKPVKKWEESYSEIFLDWKTKYKNLTRELK